MISLVHLLMFSPASGSNLSEFHLGVDQLVEQLGAIDAFGLGQPGFEFVGRFLGLGHFAELYDHGVDLLGHLALGRPPWPA